MKVLLVNIFQKKYKIGKIIFIDWWKKKPPQILFETLFININGDKWFISLQLSWIFLAIKPGPKISCININGNDSFHWLRYMVVMLIVNVKKSIELSAGGLSNRLGFEPLSWTNCHCREPVKANWPKILAAHSTIKPKPTM